MKTFISQRNDTTGEYERTLQESPLTIKIARNSGQTVQTVVTLSGQENQNTANNSSNNPFQTDFNETHEIEVLTHKFKVQSLKYTRGREIITRLLDKFMKVRFISKIKPQSQRTSIKPLDLGSN